MINQETLAQIQGRIATHNKRRNGQLHFSVEYGNGETYRNNNITIYAHDEYEESSVLAGRSRRMWIGTFSDEQEAKDTIEAAGITKKTDFMLGGSTHIPISQIVSHIPDDTDY